MHKYMYITYIWSYATAACREINDKKRFTPNWHGQLNLHSREFVRRQNATTPRPPRITLRQTAATLPQILPRQLRRERQRVMGERVRVIEAWEERGRCVLWRNFMISSRASRHRRGNTLFFCFAIFFFFLVGWLAGINDGDGAGYYINPQSYTKRSVQRRLARRTG